MNTINILGIPAVVVTGVILLMAVIFSALSGLGVIKASIRAHKISGIIILTLGIIHAILGMMLFYGN